MPSLTFELATSADDPALRALLRRIPIPGDVCLTFEREPSYFAACEIEGSFHQTIVARSLETGQIVGFANRSVRELYVNGTVQPVGYLSQLRAESAHSWGLSLARSVMHAFAFCRGLHSDSRAPFYLMSIVAANERARRLLTSSLGGMPKVEEYTLFRIYAIALGRRKPSLPLSDGLELRRATGVDSNEILSCLHRNGKRHQFAPRWTKQALFGTDGTGGLSPERFFLTTDGGRIVSCLASWDQSDFKQAMVRGYSSRLGRWRPFLNFAARLTGWPPLPSVGMPVKQCFASHLAVDHDDVDLFAPLLRAVYNDAAERGASYLLLGLPDAHPFRPIVEAYRHISYPSQLYLVGWEDSWEAMARVDRRIPGVEAAVL